MKPKEIALDMDEKNGKQLQEIERQQRDHLRRQLLEEAKNKQLEKKMKKSARRKARNKKLPQITTSSGQTSTRPSPVYTSSSNGCCMEKTVSSLQNDASVVSSDAFDHHKPLSPESVGRFSDINVKKSKALFTIRTKQSIDKLSDFSFSVEENICNNQLDTLSPFTDGQTLTENHEVTDWLLSPGKIEQWILLYQKLALDKKTKVVRELRDSSTDVPEYHDSMMLDSAKITPNEGKEHLKTHAFSVSVVPRHLKPASIFTLPVCGHYCLTYCKFWGDKDAMSAHKLGIAEFCGTNKLFSDNTGLATVHSKGADISECIDSNQPSIPCLSLIPSSSSTSSHLPYKQGEAVEAGKSCCLHNRQIQRHASLNVGNMQLQGCQLKIILSNVLSQYYSGTDISNEDLKHNLETVPYQKFLSQIFQQRGLQVMLTKALSEPLFCALMKMHYYKNILVSCPSHPMLKGISCEVFSSQKESFLKECTATSASRSQLEVSEKAREASDDTVDIAVHKCNIDDCQSGKSCKESLMQNKNYENSPTTKTQLMPSLSSCENTELAVERVPQIIECHPLTAADRNAESCQDTHSDTSDEGYAHGEDFLNERNVISDLWCPIRQEFVPDNWDDDLSSSGDIIDSPSMCATVDVFTSTPPPVASDSAFVESDIDICNNESTDMDICNNESTDIDICNNESANIDIFNNESADIDICNSERQCRKQLLDVEISEENISCCQELVTDVTNVCDNNNKQTPDTVCDARELGQRNQCNGSDEVKLPSMAVPLFPHKTVLKMQQQRKQKYLSKENQLLKPDLTWHQSTNLGSFTETERNKSNGTVWPARVVTTESHPQRLNTADVLTHHSDHLHVDTEVEKSSDKCESTSYLSKTFGALQNSSQVKIITENGVVIKGPKLLFSDTPVCSSKNCILADFVNPKEAREIDHNKDTLLHGAQIVEDNLPGVGLSNSAIVGACRDCSYENIKSVCDANVHRKWKLMPGSVLKAGTGEASVNHFITGHKCQQEAEEFSPTSLTPGNSDHWTSTGCFTNKQIFKCDRPVNNESFAGSVHINSSINKSPDQRTTGSPILLHPSTVPAASNKLPTKSDLHHLLTLTLEKEQERLYFLLCDLQTKVLTLARMLKSRKIIKSSSAEGGDIDGLKNTTSLPGDKELSLEQIEVILGRFVPVADKCVVSAPEYTPTKSVQWNKCAQNDQNTFSLQYDQEHKQVDQRELSDAELDNVLKRLHLLGIDDVKTPHTRRQGTAHSTNQGCQVKGLNSYRCVRDQHLYGLSPKLAPVTCEQRHTLRDQQLHSLSPKLAPTTSEQDWLGDHPLHGLSPKLALAACEQKHGFSDQQLHGLSPKLAPATCEQKHGFNDQQLHGLLQKLAPGTCEQKHRFSDQQLHGLSPKLAPTTSEQKHWLSDQQLHGLSPKLAPAVCEQQHGFSDQPLHVLSPKLAPATCEQKHSLKETNAQLQTQTFHNNNTNKTVSSCKDAVDQFIQHPHSPSRNSAEATWNLEEPQRQLMTELPSGHPRISHAETKLLTTANNPCKSREENMINVSKHNKNTSPFTFLRRRMIKKSGWKSGCSFTERTNMEMKILPDVSTFDLPTHVGHTPPNTKEPNQSTSLSGAALHRLRKNIIQKTEPALFNYRLPSQSQQPVLTVSKTLPKKAAEFYSQDTW